MACGCKKNKGPNATPAGGVPATRPSMGDPVTAAIQPIFSVVSASGSVVRHGFTSKIAADQYAKRVNGTVIRA